MKRFSGVTTSQIARICGVSQGTVDRALHNRGEIRKETKDRILAVAKEYGYTPNVKNASGGKSMLIGCILFDLYNAFFSKLAMDLVEKAKEMGYSVIFQFSDKNLDDEKRAIEYFNYIGVDGIVLFSAGTDSPEYSCYLRSLNRPVITIGNKVSNIEYIGIDDEGAMYELTKIMLRKCKEKVAYFAPVLKKALNKENAQYLRLNGYKRAVAEAGMPFFILTAADKISSDYNGIISSTDLYLLRTLSILGYDTSVKLAGFDNIIDSGIITADYISVDYSTKKIAEECIKYILGRAYLSEIPYTIQGT